MLSKEQLKVKRQYTVKYLMNRGIHSTLPLRGDKSVYEQMIDALTEALYTPHLGCATTKELLDEVAARSGDPDYTTIDFDEHPDHLVSMGELPESERQEEPRTGEAPESMPQGLQYVVAEDNMYKDYHKTISGLKYNGEMDMEGTSLYDAVSKMIEQLRKYRANDPNIIKKPNPSFMAPPDDMSKVETTEAIKESIGYHGSYEAVIEDNCMCVICYSKKKKNSKSF